MYEVKDSGGTNDLHQDRPMQVTLMDGSPVDKLGQKHTLLVPRVGGSGVIVNYQKMMMLRYQRVIRQTAPYLPPSFRQTIQCGVKATRSPHPSTTPA